MKTINAKTKDLRALNTALKESVNGTPVTVQNASQLHGIGAGLKHGEVIIESDAGDYVGVLNAGATIKVAKKCIRAETLSHPKTRSARKPDSRKKAKIPSAAKAAPKTSPT